MSASVFFLTVFIFSNGTFLRGDIAEPAGGWHPRSYETLEICQTRRAFSMEQNAMMRARDERVAEMRYFCSAGAPLETMPEE